MTTTTTTAANDYRDVDEVLIRAFRNALDARLGRDYDFSTRESAGLGLANVLCRIDQEGDLVRRSALFTRDELWIEGKRYTRHDKRKTSKVVYHGLCGPLEVERALYREAGVRNGPTVVPLEVDAGLMEGLTPGLAGAVAHGYAESPSRISNEYLRAAHRVPPSRSTTERAAKRIGAAMEEALDSIEPIIRMEETLPEGTCGISLGIDRTSVPMEEPAGPNKKPSTRTKPYLRAVPDPVEVNYRMAYVGTISAFDEDGRSLVTRRYGLAGDRDPKKLMDRLMADLRRHHAQDPTLQVAALMDGAPEMWNLSRAALRAEPSVTTWNEGIDRHHLAERLANALREAHLTKGWREKQLEVWSTRLDEDDAAIDDIETYITSLRDGLRGEARKKLSEHVTYIANNKDRMRYASLRAKCVPIGSGATEGACKSLVMVRAKACGQRWHDDGIDALLVMRGLHLSDRLPRAMELLRRKNTAVVRFAA